MQPTAVSSVFINEIKPVKIDSIFQAGFQVSGWYSEIERQMLLFYSNQPFGVIIFMAGGLCGYSGGNFNYP